MDKFKVSFTENKKYNPASRTIGVEAKNVMSAIMLIQQQFGRKKINITSVIGKDGVDLLKAEKEEAIDVSVDMDNVKVKFTPSGEVILTDEIADIAQNNLDQITDEENTEITNELLLMSSDELDEYIGELT